MWGAALIVFREVFEIAIILCVVLAATKGVKDRNKYIGIGIFGGSIAACLFALFTEAVSIASGETGKMYFNAAILIAATSMIVWTVIWMKHHGRTIVSQMKSVGQSIVAGEKPLYILSTVIGLAVMREGSEIVVFLYGLMAAGQTSTLMLLLGSLLGLGMGVGFGLFMYFGLLRISVKHTFQMTSLMLTFIAAGMAANAAGKLVKTGLLPTLVNSLWNTSAILPQHSVLGRFLFILVGYQENPNGMQALFYVATLAIIFYAGKRLSRTQIAAVNA